MQNIMDFTMTQDLIFK